MICSGQKIKIAHDTYLTKVITGNHQPLTLLLVSINFIKLGG